MYNEVDYARTRLEGTIITHKGKPLRVHHISSGRVVTGFDSDGNETTAPLDECQLTQHKLGFVNYRDGVSYLVRIPKRRDWRQGLRGNNTYFKRLCGGDVQKASDTRIMKCLEGVFPDVADALDTVTRIDSPVAISRSFALQPKRGGICLNFRNRGVVGVYRDGEWVLSDKYAYLERMLREEGVWLTQ